MMKSGARWVLVGSLVSILMMGGLGLAMGKKVEKEEATAQVEEKQIEVQQKHIDPGKKGEEEAEKAEVNTGIKVEKEGKKATSEEQRMGSNRPLFIPQRERIKENIHNRIFVTEKAVGPHLIPDRIYFADKEENLITSRDIFPEDTKKRGSVRIFKSPGGKYIAVESDYSIPADATDTEAWEFEGEFVRVAGSFKVMDEKGKVLWEFSLKGDEYENVWREVAENQYEDWMGVDVFLTDDGKVIFGYLHEGYLDIYTVNGNRIKKTKISDWGEKVYPEEEPLIFPKAMISSLNQLIIVRSAYYPEKRSEVISLSLDENVEIMWKIEDKGIERDDIVISPNGKFIVSWKNIRDINMKTMELLYSEFFIEVLDSSTGNIRWERSVGKYAFRSLKFLNNDQVQISIPQHEKEYRSATKYKYMKQIFDLKGGELIREE